MTTKRTSEAEDDEDREEKNFQDDEKEEDDQDEDEKKKKMKMINICKKRQRKFQKSFPYCIYPQLSSCETQDLEKGLKKRSRGLSITVGMRTAISRKKVSGNHGQLFWPFQAHQHGTPIVLENLDLSQIVITCHLFFEPSLNLLSTVTGYYFA